MDSRTRLDGAYAIDLLNGHAASVDGGAPAPVIGVADDDKSRAGDVGLYDGALGDTG